MATSFNQFQGNNLSNLKALQKLFTENEGTIVELSAAVSKMESRLKQQEDIMTTSVALCTEALSHMSRGTVKYSSVESTNQEIKIANLKSTQTKPEVLLPVMTSMESPSSHFVAGQTNSQSLDHEDPYGLIWEDQEDGLGFDRDDPYGMIWDDQEDYEVGLGFE